MRRALKAARMKAYKIHPTQALSEDLQTWGARAWGLRVRGFLNAKFPDRWIGRDGPIHWAARSPDLTPLDFFLWGHVKSQVYRPNVSYSTVEDLKTEIRRIIQEIGKDVLTRVVESVPERYRRCVENGGRHVEQFD